MAFSHYFACNLPEFGKMNKKYSLFIKILGHFLTGFSLIIFLTGCLIIGFVAWILSTNIVYAKFHSNHLILTYITIGIGFSLWFTGLVGWVASSNKTTSIIRLFILMSFVTASAFFGGILSLQVAKVELEDVLRRSWKEINGKMRNYIQNSLYCCGFGSEIFRENYIMESSCFEDYHGQRRMKQGSCGIKLKTWFDENKSIWLTIIILLTLVIIFAILSACAILYFMAKRSKYSKKKRIRRKKSRSTSQDSKRILFLESASSENSSGNFRDSI